jgi:phospholipid-binding lipoprotein MlaA
MVQPDAGLMSSAIRTEAGRSSALPLAPLFAAIVLTGLLYAPLATAATPKTTSANASASDPSDPWESTNRRFFNGYQSGDRKFFRPLAMLYHALTPGFIGKGIHNILTNLSEPVVLANDLLQFRVKRAGETTLRIVANTTAGWGGIMDVAGYAGLRHHDNSFGVTLGRYGVGPGPYVFLPILGPSTVRDLAGTVVDGFMDPTKLIGFPHRTEVDITVAVVGGLDTRVEHDGDLTALFADSADPYATLRSTYLQNRQGEIEGRDAPAAVLPDIESEPSPGAPPDQAAPEAPTPSSADQPAPPPPSAALTPQNQELAAEDAPMMSAGGDDRASGAAPIRLAEASL